jgi:PTH1 family peptidyl-tRNA hydrolase
VLKVIKLIVGLGNPGQQYEKTRHNAGFLFLDRLASELGVFWVSQSKFQCSLAEANIGNTSVMLLKPTTFMNRSGESVGKVARYYKVMPEEILVVHDELDFNPGVLRLKISGGHAGHNGLRDIISHLGSNEFYRLRIGIGRPDQKQDVANFVLSQPTKLESEMIGSAIELGQSFMAQMVSGDIATVMNKMNS